MKSAFCYGVLCVLGFSSTVFAQTVPDHVYLQNEIDQKSKALSYDELQKVFEKSPVFQSHCVIDKATQPENDKEDEAIFKEYLSKQYGEGLIIFKFLPLRYGFSILAEKLNPNNKVQAGDVESFRAETACGAVDSAAISSSAQDKSHESQPQENETQNAGDDSKNKNCGSLMFTHEMQISIPEQDGDYSPEATKEESWQVYYMSANTMLAQVSVSFTGESRNWLGNKSGTVSVSHHYICEMTLLEGQ